MVAVKVDFRPNTCRGQHADSERSLLKARDDNDRQSHRMNLWTHIC